MKKLFALFLAVLLISQMFVNVGIGVYYHINKEYIAKQLCENRNKPAMHCNGHCYLSKQLQKAEDREQKSSNVLKEKEEIISTEPAFSALHIEPVITGSKVFASYTANVYLHNHAYGIIQPPEAA